MVLQLDSAATLGPPPKMRYQGDAYPLGDYKAWIGKNIPMFGVSCSNSHDLLLQLNGEETNQVLDQLEEYINSIPEDSRTGPPRNAFLKEQSSCLAVYHADSSWYRARVIKRLPDSDTYKVTFVDYGNIENVPVDKLMTCPPKLMDFVEGITPCALADFDGDETGEDLAILQSAICEKDLIGRIDSVEHTVGGKWRMLVTLFGDHNGTPFKEHLRRLKRKGVEEKKETVNTKMENNIEQFMHGKGMNTENNIEKKKEGTVEKRKKEEKVSNPYGKPMEMPKPLAPRQSQRVEVAIPVDVVDGNSNLRCVYCNYLAKGKLDFVKHNLSCTSIMPEACDRCTCRSFTQIGLALHYKIHLGQP